MTLQFFPHSTTNPGKPRQPPATSTTTGQANTVADSGFQGNNQQGVPYGAIHRKLKFIPNGERSYDFKE
jgi:hypothetical protein